MKKGRERKRERGKRRISWEYFFLGVGVVEEVIPSF